MTWRSPHLLPPKCPDCASVLDSAKSLNAPAPKPGSISICAYCAGIAIFDDELALREVTEEELSLIRQDSEAWDLIQEAQRLIQENPIRPRRR